MERARRRVFPDRPVQVEHTDNRTVIISLRNRRRRTPVLRAHRCFINAPEEVAEAVVRLYLGRPSRSERRRMTHLVTTWHQGSAQPAASPGPGDLRHGRHHHLPTVLDIVNRSYFAGRLGLDITFGPRPARQVMGRHEVRTPRSLIVVNPLLDNPAVKTWYLHYLVFHECLHEQIPPRSRGGRLQLHPPEFRRRESLHPDIGRARRYEAWLTGPGYPRLLAEYEAAHGAGQAGDRRRRTAGVRGETGPSRGRPAPARRPPG